MAYPIASPHFLIVEFVPPEIWNQFGESSSWFVDPRIVDACEKIRVYFNKPVTVNNWHLQGQYKESGFRMPSTTTGATLSQHRFGRACDIKVKGISPEEVRDAIRMNWKSFGVTTIEKDTPTWTHIDVRETKLSTLLEVPYQ